MQKHGLGYVPVFGCLSLRKDNSRELGPSSQADVVPGKHTVEATLPGHDIGVVASTIYLAVHAATLLDVAEISDAARVLHDKELHEVPRCTARAARMSMRAYGVALAAVVVAGCGVLPGPCEQRTFTGTFCIPDAGVAPAGQALSFEITHCGGCNTETLSCVATRDAGVIDLSLAGRVCNSAQGCPAVCRIDRFNCALPALEEGDYVIRSGTASQALRVRDAGVASCTGAEL